MCLRFEWISFEDISSKKSPCLLNFVNKHGVVYEISLFVFQILFHFLEYFFGKGDGLDNGLWAGNDIAGGKNTGGFCFTVFVHIQKSSLCQLDTGDLHVGARSLTDGDDDRIGGYVEDFRIVFFIGDAAVLVRYGLDADAPHGVFKNPDSLGVMDELHPVYLRHFDFVTVGGHILLAHIMQNRHMGMRLTDGCSRGVYRYVARADDCARVIYYISPLYTGDLFGRYLIVSVVAIGVAYLVSLVQKPLLKRLMKVVK